MARQIPNEEDIVLQRGIEIISDALVHNMPANNKPFVAIQAVTAIVIAVLTGDALSPISGNAITTLTLPPLSVIYGRFTSIQLTSGTAIAYKGC